MNAAVFLDRDGVVVEDNGVLARASDIRIPSDVPRLLAMLSAAGFPLVVISNQTVVSRGLLTEGDAIALQHAVEAEIATLGGPMFDGFYYCPHHPNATLPAYRIDCDCRKPHPGLLHRAAHDLGLDLKRSVFIGDRMSDVAAGHAAGCRTVLLRSGAHLAPPIEGARVDPSLSPDFACDTLDEAVRWILAHVKHHDRD
ncbi:MAG: HAD-IIIA family hydrolase [Dehalococcoidia bacterium]|nr:MAG: HAD-IIIA family hydrolase [Dehalococcoidia bacterium]